jgi:hypothetical protein
LIATRLRPKNQPNTTTTPQDLTKNNPRAAHLLLTNSLLQPKILLATSISIILEILELLSLPKVLETILAAGVASITSPQEEISQMILVSDLVILNNSNLKHLVQV